MKLIGGNMKRLISIGLVGVITLGCGSSSSHSENKALVSSQQLADAFDIIEEIDYLPYAFTTDGCYARALYMSMELASSAIPSSSLYVMGDLQPNDQTRWRYHVAPLITEEDFSAAYILDPSLLEAPASIGDWVIASDELWPDDEYNYWLADGSRYIDDEWLNINYSAQTDLLQQSAVLDGMLQSFEEMPAFSMEDVNHACKTMHRYWGGVDGLSSGSLALIREKLLERSQQLVTRLSQLGKIDGGQFTCR